MELAFEYRAANNAGTLEAQVDASWGHLLAEHRSAEKANADIYLDGFILVVQEGARERRQMLQHLFH